MFISEEISEMENFVFALEEVHSRHGSVSRKLVC